MLNALTFLTRDCPRACDYCAIRDAKDVGTELTTKQWKEAFRILKSLDIDFNLILGNETWLLKDSLIEIMQYNQVPYALYTTCPEPLFSKYRDKMFKVIDNLSCGVDWPLSYLEKKDVLVEDSEKKSLDAWRGFQWFKKHHPEMDCQGTVTIHRGNVELLPSIINELSQLEVFVGVNFIQWNKDGNFDFFPPKEELDGLIISENSYAVLDEVFKQVLQRPGLLQNPEMLQESPIKLLSMGWHCGGNPYGGPTIDSDGSLRVCGYRKGYNTTRFSIFDLPQYAKDWQRAVYRDARNCPGCAWSYPWMFHYWSGRDSEMGNKVFTKHAGHHISKKKWAKRKLEG